MGNLTAHDPLVIFVAILKVARELMLFMRWSVVRGYQLKQHWENSFPDQEDDEEDGDDDQVEGDSSISPQVAEALTEFSGKAHACAMQGLGALGRGEMVLWSSSELPDAGMRPIDYQTNPAVDRWLREKVLLAPTTTSCTVHKGVFVGEGAMLRAIAYGHELNLAHPPRPADPKVAWEPEWALKVRVKSVASAVVGMPSMDEAMRGAPRENAEPQAQQPPEKKPGPLDILRGVLGR